MKPLHDLLLISLVLVLPTSSSPKGRLKVKYRVKPDGDKVMVKTLMLYLMCSQSTVLNQGSFFTSFTPEILSGGCF